MFTRTLLRLEVPGSSQAYALSYRMAPRNRDSFLDLNFSHCLHGWMMSTCLGRNLTLQAWRRTVFTANEWVHTRLLLHFNGDLECEAAGYGGESPARLR